MEKIFRWENAQAKGKAFTITAYASSLDDARRLVLAEIAPLIPQPLSEEEGKALLDWVYENEPGIEHPSAPLEGPGVSIAERI